MQLLPGWHTCCLPGIQDALWPNNKLLFANYTTTVRKIRISWIDSGCRNNLAQHTVKHNLVNYKYYQHQNEFNQVYAGH